jgi:hypothetical protein
MSFSEHLKPQPKQNRLPWYMAGLAWLLMAYAYYFFYAWLYIAVAGSSSSFPNPALTISVMQNTALSVAAVSFLLLVFRKHAAAFIVLAFALPLAFASVFLTR